MDDRISKLLDEIEDMEAEDCQPVVDYWKNEQVAAARAQLRRLQGEQAYEEFLLDYVVQEHERFQPPEASRETVLCTCSNKCPVKRGELPSRVQMADSLQAGVRAYKEEHVGEPRVLIEARERWSEAWGAVERTLRDVRTAMKRDELPPGVTKEDVEAQIGALQTPDDTAAVAEQPAVSD